MPLKLIVIVLLVVSGLLGSAKSSADIFSLGKLAFQNLHDFDQLASPSITALTEDDQGFIWVGTQYGLVRYDGYRLRTFLHDANQPQTSLVGNFISALWSAEDGRLWIATNADGLSVYDPRSGTFRNYRHQRDNPNSLASNQIKALIGDNHGGIWIGTNNGLDYLDTNNGQFEHFIHHENDAKSLSNNHIRSLLIDRKGELWIGSWDGLNRFKADTRQFERIASDPNQPRSLAANNVFSLFQSHDGKIWIGTTAKGAAFLSPEQPELHWLSAAQPVSNDNKPFWILRMAQISADKIWLATNGEGILIVSTKDGKILRHIRHDASLANSINDDSVSALLIDQSGLLWIGTWGNGINRYNPTNQAFRSLHHSQAEGLSLSESDIRSVLELQSGDIWLGTKSNGIDIINPESGKLSGLRPSPQKNLSLSANPIMALAQTPDQTVWIGTRDNGLFAYHPQQSTLKKFDNVAGEALPAVRSILPDAQGKLWIASDAGLWQFDPSSASFQHFTQTTHADRKLSSLVNAIALQQDGTLWVGSNDGLFVLPPGGQQLIPFEHDANQLDSLSHNYVAGLLVDSQDRLWVSTDQGLDRLVEWNAHAAHFESINQKVKDPDHLPFGNLLEDSQGRIWGNEAMLDPRGWQLNSFSLADGNSAIGGWIGAFGKTRRGILMFAGTHGLALINPDRLALWNYQPPLVISKSSINSLPHHIEDSLVLAPLSKGFSIEFSALDFSAPQSLQYAYYLEGFDKDWINTDALHRVASYTNLAPADYVLHVKASNRKGQWSPHQLTLPVQQQAAWFQQRWLKMLMIFLVVLLVFPAIKWRERQLQKRQNQLERLVEQRTKELEIKNRELEQLSLTDQLTTAKNRRFVDQFMHQEIAMLDRKARPDGGQDNPTISFLMIDIDNFKSINDHFGHKAGDMVLIEFVHQLQKICRESDWVVRWGGEEFLIIMREQQHKSAAQLAERIRTGIEHHRFKIPHSEPVKITCSIGLTRYPFFPQQRQILSWEQTLNLADVALYMAKQQGRNRWISLLGLKLSSEQAFYKQFIDDPQNAIERGEVLCHSSASSREHHD